MAGTERHWLRFAYLERDADADLYQGHELHASLH